jgi:phage tail-like protein
MQHRARKALLAAALTGGSLVTFVVTANKAPAQVADPAASTVTRVAMVIDGTEIATFSRCLGLGTESEVIPPTGDPTKEATFKSQPKPTVKRTVCERPLTDSRALAAWRETVDQGQMTGARKSASVVMYNQANTPIYRWWLTDTWPAELTNYFENGVGREIVTFVYEASQRVSPS